MLNNDGGGIMVIGEVKASPFRCERCGCSLICGPQELLLCSTCLPAEVVELRAEVARMKQLALSEDFHTLYALAVSEFEARMVRHSARGGAS